MRFFIVMLAACGVLSLLAMAPGCGKKAVGGDGTVPPGTVVDPRLYKGPAPESSKLLEKGGQPETRTTPPSANGK